MNAPFNVAPAQPIRRARRRSRTVVSATLQVTGEQACLVTEEGDPRCWTLPALAAPRQILERADGLLREGLAAADRTHRRSQVRWRIVLPGGYHHLSTMPSARWSRVLGEAIAGELEPDCPLALDELSTASLPIGDDAAWTVALPHGCLESWHNAASELGLLVEGFWTPASALVEYLLENPPSQCVRWADGRTIVTVEPNRVDDRGSTGGSLRAIRVLAAPNDPFCTLTPPAPLNNQGDSGPQAASPVVYPALWTQSLRRVDPSESLNLARGQWAPSDLAARRQRPLAIACGWLGALCVLVGIGALLVAEGHRQRAASYGSEVGALWSHHHGDAPQPAMTVDTLQKQVNAWRNLRERGMLGRRNGSELAQLARWTAALPSDLLVNVDHVRCSGADVWIDGQVKSQADARRLFESLAAIPGVTTDSMRTSPGAGGLVGFSLRLSLARP